MRLKSIGAVAVLGIAAGSAAIAAASPHDATDFTNVSSANTKSPGYAPPNLLSPELQQITWAQGSYTLENPDGLITHYGYLKDGPMVPAAAAPTVEASKTEPDKNTYLVFAGGLHGPDAAYDYGHAFLFQGHEGNAGYVTRINLDADAPHRVTLLADKTKDGTPLKTIDGSTWDPFAQRLLFTVEAGANGAVYQATPDYPSQVDDVTAFIGRGGFEGIQNDSLGSLYIVEDVGGANGTGANARAKQPNSFVYRFVPNRPSDLTKGGKIQALQVSVDGTPLVFGPTADGDINAPRFVKLHTYGQSFPTRWITIATTDSSTAAPGPDDNALAKAAGATPFKRPENGVFRPGTKFTEFYFDETGDTDNRTSAAASGGFGALFRLVQSPSTDVGSISVLYNGDAVHAGFDNVQFLGRDALGVVEDAGDTLHTQRNALDSAWLFDVSKAPGTAPVRFIAQGRDPSATIDSGLSGSPGFHNDGDNELTGLHVSDGYPGLDGILGVKVPRLFKEGWRAFYTEQHGDNVTYELVPAPGRGGGGDHGDD